MPGLLVLDSASLHYRAFYALPESMTSPQGEPVNAVRGFLDTLSRLIDDDHEQLQQGMVMYDALYLWCKEGQDEHHTWNPGLDR